MHYTKIKKLYFFIILILISCAEKDITFHNQIKPIIHRNCAICHHPKGSGPFDLITYRDVSKRTKMIAEVIQKKYMPPWPADSRNDNKMD